VNENWTGLIIPGMVAFLLTLVLGKPVISLLHRLKFGQSIREVGPESHQKKAGTPTMGGLLILLALTGGLLIRGRFSNETIALLLITFSYALIGLVDDLLSVVAKHNLGLKAWQKMFLQMVFAVFAVWLVMQNQTGLDQIIPFTRRTLSFGTDLTGQILFGAYAVFVFAAMTNAVNLTDGLDGLAAGTVAIAALALGLIGGMQNQPEIAAFAVILAGACLGFLWFNGPPAQVFMGDTGSLSLGGALTGIALFSRTTLFLPIIGAIFVAEVLSVIIQVAYFKKSGGKRIFRMSPLHHHFELGGMTETKVVVRFWLATLLLAIIGILSYMLPLC
jgi:phospho-N-acetylmuramoyl-pentapeptide-transferase